jgi:hypothetical protein
MSNSRSQKSLPITRREIGAGLAFAEEYDLQRLSQWAAEGWRLVKINSMSMILEQASPEQVVFAIDYQDAPDVEYFALCATAGWQHVVSVEHVIHLFKAPPGTPAIFSAADMTTKYQRAARIFAKPAMWSSMAFVFAVVVFFGGIQQWLVTNGNPMVALVGEIVATIVLFAIATISIFTLLPWLAYRLRLAGMQFSMNRLVFVVIFTILGGVLGYFLGAMILS